MLRRGRRRRSRRARPSLRRSPPRPSRSRFGSRTSRCCARCRCSSSRSPQRWGGSAPARPGRRVTGLRALWHRVPFRHPSGSGQLPSAVAWAPVNSRSCCKRITWGEWDRVSECASPPPNLGPLRGPSPQGEGAGQGNRIWDSGNRPRPAVIASEAKQSPESGAIGWGLPRRCAPRNDRKRQMRMPWGEGLDGLTSRSMPPPRISTIPARASISPMH
jgi:hypothetical protein